MKLTTTLAAAAAVALLAAGSAFAQGSKAQEKSSSAQSAGQKESKADAKRMREMAQANLAEIEAGKLAAEKAQSEDVKKFAQKMVDDHSKMLEDLKKVAEAKNVELPSAPDSRHQKLMKRLQAASGEKFDQEYMQAMVKDHRDAAKLTQRTAKSAKDPELQSAAKQAHTQIQEHQKMAQQIAKAEKPERRSAAGSSAQPAKSGSGSQAGAGR